MNALDKALLRRCVELSEEAAASGNHPFGALLQNAPKLSHPRGA